MRNYTIVDVMGTLKACLVLAPVMFAPGYVAGWLGNVFDFRRHSRLLRLALAVPLSIAIAPMISYLLACYIPPGLAAFYLLSTVACVVLLARNLKAAESGFELSHKKLLISIFAFWTLAVALLLSDLQIGNQLYPPLAAFDHCVRTAMMASIARHMPPNNPFFANPATPLRYHYLWMLLCGLPMKIARFSPRQLLYGGTFWCGVGLAGVIALGLKFFSRARSGLERKFFFGIGLLGVTGLDILPILYIAGTTKAWRPDMEWWNTVQITSWAASLLWVPHNVAALIACFLGYVLLRYQSNRLANGPGQRWQTVTAVVVAGMAFASSAGLSIYVAFTFFVGICLWSIALVARKNWKEMMMFAAAGAFSVAWALPYLSSLRTPGSGGDRFVAFALRPFPIGIEFLRNHGVTFPNETWITAANLAFLPLNYALELGFFLAVGLLRFWQLRHKKITADNNELAGWTLVMASFVIGTFLHSTTIGSNDLGFRCFLPAQLMLLIWGGGMLADWQASRKPGSMLRWFRVNEGRNWLVAAFSVMLLLGLLGTAYEVFMLRMFPVLSDRYELFLREPAWPDQDQEFGKRTYALRQAYEVLNAQLPESAVVQHNPDTSDYVPDLLYSQHESAAGTMDCGTAFGGDPKSCDERIRRIVPVFETPGYRGIEGICRHYGIDVVLVKDTDGAWKQPSSWVWTLTPLVANDYLRAFRCPDNR